MSFEKARTFINKLKTSLDDLKHKIEDVKQDSLKEYYFLLEESNEIHKEIIDSLYRLCEMLNYELLDLEDRDEYLAEYKKEIAMYEEYYFFTCSDLEKLLYTIQEQDPNFVPDMITENSRASVIAEV